jgi:hypothetical protein
MKIQAASILLSLLTLSSSCQAFVPSSLSHRTIIPSHSIAPQRTHNNHHGSVSSSLLHPRRSKKSAGSTLHMASSEDFDQTKYTEAAWATLAALPACADSYSSTSVEAPMLLGILLNPTKYQAGESAVLRLTDCFIVNGLFVMRS